MSYADFHKALRSLLIHESVLLPRDGLRTQIYEAIMRAVSTTACPHAQKDDPGRALLVLLNCDIATCVECLPAFRDHVEQTHRRITDGEDKRCDVCRQESDYFRPFCVYVDVAVVLGEVCERCWELR